MEIHQLQPALPPEDSVVDIPPQTPAVNPGHLWKAGASECPVYEPEALSSQEDPHLVWQCHLEVMKTLQRHEHLLNKLAQRKLQVPSMSEVSSVNSGGGSARSRHSSGCSAERSPRSVRSQEVVHSILSGSGSTLKAETSSPNLFQSFTAYDLNRKEEAQAASTQNSRRKYAKMRMEKALGASVISTKEALEKVQRVVLHPFFDIFFALVVFSNAIFIGLEVDSSMSGEWISPSTISVTTYTYASLFALELLARLIAAGCSFFYSEDCIWNYLDISVVLASLVEIVATSIFTTANGGQSNVSGLKVFRIIRLTKVVKTVRLVRIFRFVMALRTLVTSIAHTLKALFWALTLLSLIVYVFAILFSQAVHSASLEAETADAASVASEKYFRSLPDTMLTLFMSIAGGVSWEHVIYPLKDIHITWALFFLFYVAFTYFAVLNVVTGVFCQSAIENAQKDQASVVQNILDNKESHLKKIRLLFSKLGADDAGKITYEMLKEHIRTPAMRVYFESLGLDVSDAWSFFKLLDEDEGGAVEIEEFLLGCLRLRGQARAMDIAKLMYDQNWLIKSQGKFQLFVEEGFQALTHKVTKLSVLLSKDEAEAA